jgi:hypothetical protein
VERIETVYGEVMKVGERLAGRRWRAVRAALGLEPGGASTR